MKRVVRQPVNEAELWVEECIGTARTSAGLDDGPILPRPETLPGAIVFARKDPLPPWPSARPVAMRHPGTPALALAPPPAPILPSRAGLPFPVLLCGLIASIATGAALVRAPIHTAQAREQAPTAQIDQVVAVAPPMVRPNAHQSETHPRTGL